VWRQLRIGGLLLLLLLLCCSSTIAILQDTSGLKKLDHMRNRTQAKALPGFRVWV